MYLTRIDLDQSTKYVQHAMADRQKLHQLIMGCFDTDRKSSHILFRVQSQDRKLSLYIYSSWPIDKTRLLPEMSLVGERDLSDWLAHMKAGQIFSFDILVAPTMKKSRSERRNSRRRILPTTKERKDWLTRKGERNGFIILKCDELRNHFQYGCHSEGKGGKFHLTGYHYQGILQITDSNSFQHAIQEGIGSGKAYGLGMLLLR